ncbi:MAG: hypothetical protein AMXMBFR8_29990 [Nevskiales bacterium]
MREHVDMIRHQHAGDQLERSPEPRPHIGASEAVLERPGAGSGARDEMQELEVCHAWIMRASASGRT